MPADDFNIKGLTDEEVLAAREKYGNNLLAFKKEKGFFYAVKTLAKEPMLILLFVAASLYFVTGDFGDGIFMASAIILVAAISLYQDSRSRNALEKLKDFTQPACKVIRNGAAGEIKSEDLVVGDSLIAEEGAFVNADGIIIPSNDCSVNESILQGESMTVFKEQAKTDNLINAGTSVAGG